MERKKKDMTKRRQEIHEINLQILRDLKDKKLRQNKDKGITYAA
jgi:hypothetical protein